MPGTSIEFAPLLPWLLIAALAAMAVLVCAVGLLARAKGAVWRAFAFAVLIATLLNPSLVNELREPLKDVAVVVVDDSASQRIGARREQAAAALRAIETEAARMNETLELRVVHIGGEGLAGADRGTRLMTPLRRALSDVPARRVAGVIVLTDGQVHDAPNEAEQAALPKPLHVLITGARDESDRRLVVVKAPTFGIVGKPMGRGLVRRALMAETTKIPLWVEHSISSGVNQVFQAHQAAAFPGIEYTISVTHVLEDDLMLEPFTMKDGFYEVPKKPGLGVSLDMDAIDKYRIA